MIHMAAPSTAHLHPVVPESPQAISVDPARLRRHGLWATSLDNSRPPCISSTCEIPDQVRDDGNSYGIYGLYGHRH